MVVAEGPSAANASITGKHRSFSQDPVGKTPTSKHSDLDQRIRAIISKLDPRRMIRLRPMNYEF